MTIADGGIGGRWPTVLLASSATVLGMAMVLLVTSYGLAYGAEAAAPASANRDYLAMLSYGTVALGLPAIGSASDRWGRRRDEALDRLDAH